MEKHLHCKILMIASLIAFVSALVAVLDGIMNVLDLIEILKVSNDKLLTNAAINLGIDVFFAICEISVGIKIFKAVKKDEHYESYKQIPSLVKSIITPFFAVMITNLTYSIIDSFKNNTKIITGSLLTIFIVWLAIRIVSSGIRMAVLKRKLQSLNLITITLSVLSLVYLFLIFDSLFDFKNALLNSISNFINFLVILLIIAFAISATIYYIENPEVLLTESKENEDSEIIKETPKYNIVKIYLTRTKNPKINIFTYVLNALIGILSVAVGIYFFIENTLIYIKEFDLNLIISYIKSPSTIIGAFNYLYELIFNLIIPFILVFSGISLFNYIFTTDGLKRYGRLSLVQVGYLLSITFILTQAIGLILNFKNFSFKNLLNIYTLGDILILLPAILFFVFGKFINNYASDVSKGLNAGDSYETHNDKINLLTIFYAIISSLTVVGMLVNKDFALDYSLYGLLIIHLLTIITSLIEKKFTCLEYVKTKRRKLHIESTTSEAI